MHPKQAFPGIQGSNSGPFVHHASTFLSEPLLSSQGVLVSVTVPKTYLEGAQGQFKEQLDLHGVLWGEGEDNVVDAKEGDQQEGGLGQAPGDTGTRCHSRSASTHLGLTALSLAAVFPDIFSIWVFFFLDLSVSRLHVYPYLPFICVPISY